MTGEPLEAADSGLAYTPEPPYYAVIFSSRAGRNTEGYAEMAERMIELAARQPGYLGIESARGPDGLGITVSYWDSEEAIAAWNRNAEHRVAQLRGREAWYSTYELRIARVERAYGKRSSSVDLEPDVERGRVAISRRGDVQ